MEGDERDGKYINEGDESEKRKFRLFFCFECVSAVCVQEKVPLWSE